MARTSAGGRPVIVVGGGLAGLAAAARLAKTGYAVTLLEAEDRLGGSWAAFEMDGVLVDRAPGVLHFPAPWRDLFRKSGRPLEAELSRLGLALEPAAPARHVFADGTELVLPAERGQQYAVLTAAYGEPVAARWRDLLDSLSDVWQLVRPLGLESELVGRRQLKGVRRGLRSGQTVRDLATELDEPHLAALVASVAHRLGSGPEQTPAWCAVDLAVQRTFGRWTVTAAGGTEPADRSGRSSLLVEVLAARLALRRVTVRLGCRVTAVEQHEGHVTGVRTHEGERLPADAVVCTVDPWQTYGELLAPPDRHRRRALRRWAPAAAPTVSHHVSAGPSDQVSEVVALTADGVPTVTYTRPTTGGRVDSRHDFTRPVPRRGAGIAWHGFRSWLDRPPVRDAVAGLFLASPSAAGGPAPSSVILSAALAAYAGQKHLN